VGPSPSASSGSGFRQQAQTPAERLKFGAKRQNELVPKKGFDLPSFGNSFSVNKIAILIEYTGFENFSILSIRFTASVVSI
jgi:hypothetical protein